MHPIFSGGRPVAWAAFFLAIRAATSMGGASGSTWSIRSGYRTRISRTTAGQALLMAGRGTWPICKRRRVASLTSSAARATSNTSSKPSSSRALTTWSGSSMLLNWP